MSILVSTGLVESVVRYCCMCMAVFYILVTFATKEMVDLRLRSYFMAPASEPKLTKSEEVQEAIRGLKVSKAPGPNVSRTGL